MLQFLDKQKDAIEYFDEALKISPNDSRIYLFRGDSYRLMKKSDQAFANYRKSLEINPNNEMTWYYLGILQESEKDYYGSISSFTKAIELGYAPLDNAYLGRSVSYFRIGEKYKAALDANAAININPNNSKAYEMLNLTGYERK